MQTYTKITILLFTTALMVGCNKATTKIIQQKLEFSERATEKPVHIFLVRHAEKSKNDPRDPDLSEIGHKRAEALKFQIARAGVTQIYTTDYKRTKQTVQPLATYLGIEPVLYNPDLVDITAILQTATSNVLVVGHSNTTPKLANLLLGDQKYEALDESVYDKLFMITKVGDQYSSTLFQYKY